MKRTLWQWIGLEPTISDNEETSRTQQSPSPAQEHAPAHRGNDANAPLEHSRRMESAVLLARGIGHDIRNLTPPISYSTIALSNMSLPPEAMKEISAIMIAADRINMLAEQLLAFGSDERSRRELLNPTPVVTEAVKLMTSTFPNNIVVKAHVRAGLWKIRANATELFQVVMNLCVNSRDAMPAGGLLSVLLENTVVMPNRAHVPSDIPSGSYVKLTVADTGLGMSEDVRNRIFEPFFTTKGPGKGAGLGLSVVAAIIKSYKGFARVDSTAGKGTEFSLYFPAITNDSSALVPRNDPMEHSPAGATVLLVDDELIMLDVLSRALTHRGFTVITCTDGREALNVITKNERRIDVVITDITMPGIGGWEVVAGIKHSAPEIAVIAFSGSPKYFSSEFSDEVTFLKKGVSIDDLVHTINNELKRSHERHR